MLWFSLLCLNLSLHHYRILVAKSSAYVAIGLSGVGGHHGPTCKEGEEGGRYSAIKGQKREAVIRLPPFFALLLESRHYRVLYSVRKTRLLTHYVMT